MKNKFLIPILLAVALLMPGCGTNAPTKAAQAEQIVITAVNDGMSEWASYVNAGNAKQSQIDTVHKAYDGYYTAQTAAKAVIEKAIAHDPSTTQTDIDTANAAAKGAEAALLNLLNSYLKVK